MAPIDRYWSYVDVRSTDDCWVWTGGRDLGGYGVFSVNTLTKKAHRWGYEQRVGPIPEGHGVLHRCDNRACQNDKHWFTGTAAVNMQDRDSKGRQAAGMRNGTAKLTDQQVREIRARKGALQRELAAEYGVSQVLISQILLSKIWGHVGCS